MKNKIKTLLILGYIFLLILIILRQKQSGTISFMGYNALKLGNKTILFKSSKGTSFITDQDSIRDIIGIDERVNFVVISNSISPDLPKVVGDVLTMGEIDTFDKLIKVFNQDTTVTTISTNIIDEVLIIKQKSIVSDLKETTFILSKFYNCYPYYLRLRSWWKVDEKIPDQVQDLFNSFEVRK
jgi:hypothetical protein